MLVSNNSRRLLFGLTLFLVLQNSIESRSLVYAQESGDQLVAEYFRLQTERLTKDLFAGIETLDDWEAKKAEYRRQLFEMLGLDPLPKRTELNSVVSGELKSDGFLVEKLYFESMPGLYVTANLYLPMKQDQPLPGILYVCGHGRSVTDGVSNGNKAAYQRHGAWFARNGYVCLIIDTIQLGEIGGIHHGTYRENMWWWNNRGYTPAGVEAWNSIRALDYLQSRPEVDGERLGVTGRSGGGGYSWWTAALDDRIKAAVPVAGMTSLKNQVVDGCVEGHCDCMFMLNTYQWDYPLVAALVAPRPLLISNTDKDSIFPLDGVVDVHAKTRKIYELYQAKDKLGLHITEGPHKDTQELRIHAFRWFNRWLKGDDSLIDTVATDYFRPSQLRAYKTPPTDQRVTTIHESFVPLADARLPAAVTEAYRNQLVKILHDRVFRAWPQHADVKPLSVRQVRSDLGKVLVREFRFHSQAPYELAFWTVQAKDADLAKGRLRLQILTERDWNQEFEDLVGSLSGLSDMTSRKQNDVAIYFAPRGVGATAWTNTVKNRTQTRRRFMQLGQTLASAQIWDVIRCFQAIRAVEAFKGQPIDVIGNREASIWAMYATLLSPNKVGRLELIDPPQSNRESPPLLNISRFATLQQVLLATTINVHDRIELSSSSKEWLRFDHPKVTEGKIELKEINR